MIDGNTIEIQRKIMIGIVGGVGPYAGLDLTRKIFDSTLARSDQEHLPVMLFSLPGLIGDRTGFLMGDNPVNPGEAIAQILLRLEQAGAVVVGIPCNTAHAAPIFEKYAPVFARENNRLKFLHIIEETAKFLRTRHPGIVKIGLLSTLGTTRTGLYQQVFERFELEIVLPEESVQQAVHTSIYDQTYGIKAESNPVTPQATESMTQAVRHLQEKGVGAVILGCTEIPLALPQKQLYKIFLIDPTLILARALIHAVNPARLREA